MNTSINIPKNFDDSDGIIGEIQKLIEKIIDEIISHEPNTIEKRVAEFKLKYRNLEESEIAQKIIKDQSFSGGLLGAVTGLGGAILLPATISADLVKYLRIQAYMVCCLACLYEYPLDDRDALKTDLFLILSHSSIEKLKDFVCAEAEKYVKNDV